MPATDKLRKRLLKKLTELFQLNQPDLDFGFYRIMHAKAEEVQQFVDKDLLTIVKEAFGENDGQQVSIARDKYETALTQAQEFGVAEPEASKPVQEAKAALDAARESGSNEAQVYDHLYRFFERYYDDGDFVSRRYYTRETASNAAPYAVPYNGEEVKLVWANMDQYYIKSTEYFNNFSFDLSQSKDISELEGLNLANQESSPLRVHFKIITASEGEHGNIKASDSSKRQFFLHQEQPVELNEQNELVINFEYRAATAKDALTKEQETQVKEEFDAKGANKGDLPNLVMTSQIIHAAKNLADLPKDYLPSLIAPLPTDRIKQRPLLTKYINQYTSRNTMDYFIHKDLGGFLRRELDFYIKNEVMRLDDIENADAPAVETYLSKIKVLRRIAQQLIDFLAQLENFQKKLWLKKKFVTETNYCITLDRVPETLYPAIIENTAQLEEWIALFAIDEIEADLTTPAFSKPLTLAFLKANDKLVLDTQFFDESFKAKLIGSIENFDEQCDGLLIHSENFQALNFLTNRYKANLSVIYADPPYNTSASEIIYKNSYKRSSWISLMDSRLTLSKNLLSTSHGVHCTTIDDVEQKNLSLLLEEIYGEIAGTVSIRIKPSGRPIPNGFALSHEYAIFTRASENISIKRLKHSEVQAARYRELDEKGRFFWEMFRKAGSNSNRSDRPTMYYPFFVDKANNVRLPNLEFNERKETFTLLEQPFENEVIVYPIKDDGKEGCWYFGYERALTVANEFKAALTEHNEYRIYYRRRVNQGVQPTSLWFDSKYSATEHGTALLKHLFGVQEVFSYPKSIYAVEDCLRVGGASDLTNSIILDYFAGSGTTGHAAINLNREDSGKRKYILTEMGDHFNTVLKPRLAKVVYSERWKDGKPVAPETGISHCFKYIRLESYEDTLNNLVLANDPIRKKAVNANSDLKQDYLLNYMLDVETRGSQSLLNIDAFTDPTAYQLKVKKPSSDEYVTRNVDLIETFNYLIGLRVEHLAAPQTFTAEFKRVTDPHASDAEKTRLNLDGRMQQDDNGSWWFRKVEGWVPADSANPNNGQQEKVLIVWRKLTGDLEQDNLMLDEWFQKNRISTRDFEFGTIYVNGSNNLPNLKQAEDRWKVRLIEEEFMQRMWDVEG